MNIDNLTNVSDEELYQLLANEVADAIPTDDWLHAELNAEIRSNDHGLLYGQYSIENEPNQSDFQATAEMYLEMDELRKRMAESSGTPWVNAKFTLQSSGHFDISFTYLKD